jgi:prepilin-type N-terminal cleavage/methylation domain-containing protein
MVPETNILPGRPSANRGGFTLIEVLVVVAIIALLISILLPSLVNARNLAKLTIDKANCKQIGTMIAQYQADYRGYVPIMYNYYANGHGQHDAPARACWASVALRHYDASLRNLKGRKYGTHTFDPNEVWYPETGMLQAYEDNILPPFWVCPFSRGKGRGEVFVSEDAKFRYWEWRGRHEHYQTWLWRPITRGAQPAGEWPGGAGSTRRGVVQYSSITWNQIPESGVGANLWENKHLRYRQWRSNDARAAKSASLSDLAAMFCAQGEHMVFSGSNKPGRVNVNSHKTTGAGGTNVIFADTHVEWVLGSRIGWP